MIRKALAAAAAVAVLGAAGTAYLVLRSAPGEPVVITVAPGRTVREVARQLDAAGVIPSSLVFRVAARLGGLDTELRAGRYRLRRGMGTLGALQALRRGPVEEPLRLTIPEGFTVRDVARRVAERTGIPEEAFLAAATSGAVRASIQPPEVRTLEGFLFPDTYLVAEGEPAPHLVARMVRTFEERTAGLDWSFPRSRGLSPYQALIVASIVEREAKVAEDRARVAAVIYNRLARGMRLEVDATVLYDLPRHKVPTRADLRRPSPYNTYLHPGLPPTPIANPGLAAIQAALAPAPIDALWYVVVDPSGRHAFTASYQEFLRLKRLRPPQTRGGTVTGGRGGGVGP